MSHKIKHHLTDSLLLAYSAGTLNEAFSLVVASHVSFCDTCRAQLETFDMLGGALLEETGHIATLQNDSLKVTLDLIAQGLPPEPQSTRPVPGILPTPLQGYVGGDLDKVRWRSIGKGVKQVLLDTSPEASARLLYIPAGTAVPDHGHRGLELTMVLKGAFTDETATFVRGDVEVADETLEHTPVANIGEACICLAVTDAPLKFRGVLPRIAQPFLRI